MVSVTLMFQYLPLYSKGPLSPQIFSMISRDSRVMSRCCPALPSTSKRAQSLGRPLAPMPSMNLPWARWSR